jgi:hypothetical protein
METNSAREIYTEKRRFSSDSLGPDFGATKVDTFSSLLHENCLKRVWRNTLQRSLTLISFFCTKTLPKLHLSQTRSSSGAAIFASNKYSFP